MVMDRENEGGHKLISFRKTHMYWHIFVLTLYISLCIMIMRIHIYMSV